MKIIENNEHWDILLNECVGTSVNSLFFGTGIDELYISSNEKKDKFLRFLEYGFIKCKLSEFDDKSLSPIFSRDDPLVVAKRILRSWPKKIFLDLLMMVVNFICILFKFPNWQQL